MSKRIRYKGLKPRENIILRIMIILGIISFLNFYYWFFNLNLIDDSLLFWLLAFSIAYDTLKIAYMWYHYWSISIPEKPKIEQNYTVDVLTTYFPGEPKDMVIETLLAIQNMDYPHTTYLCDEANDPHLKEFCIENNIIHVTRDNRVDAKAGNINNALRQAKGDICLILDPDHIPRKNFLEAVIPYFEDESIGFVQTVQAYYNIDQSLVAKGAAEQTFLFYGPLMTSMNSYGTVNAIGANCVFRRKALDSIGGHSAGLSEDMHTAMQLHAKGWKSVYLPNTLSKGLAPASLTSFYKQQLKWARGTFELLCSTYPKLFKKFTWRQKIHYGILPLHFLSGIITLINFLIPIISLFAATTPWSGNIINFGLIFAPVFITISSIRFYIQRWLIHINERGIHITGGLLQICTWWIYNIGFLYTIIRKRIPYLPTPKEDSEPTVWILVVPNLLIALISIIAVVYGLSIDLTPFSLLMSAFALLNAIFMLYTLRFAYQKQKNVPFSFKLAFKPYTINAVQNFIFAAWRRSALLLILFAMLFFGYQQYEIENRKWNKVITYNYTNITNYLGMFSQRDDKSIANLIGVNKIEDQINKNFNVINIDIKWEINEELTFTEILIDSIYDQKSLPMISWEPVLTDLHEEVNDNKHILELILSGHFDDYINDFARKLKNLNKPVFLRFAPEFDNPLHSWYDDDENFSMNFKKTWVHIHKIFQKNNATNVMWVWNPWNSNSIRSFYPGIDYVDWVSINTLNFGKHNKTGRWKSFKDLYEPFHQELIKLPLTPVMISEFGTVKEDQKQINWYEKAFASILNEYDEIKSVIILNGKKGCNQFTNQTVDEEIEWATYDHKLIESYNNDDLHNYLFSSLDDISPNETFIPRSTNTLTTNIKGTNIKRGQRWREDYYVLSRKNLLIDFKKIKNLGINSIKFEGNSIYEYNILNIARETDLNITYGFWIPAYIDFVNDTLTTDKLKNIILKKVKKRKNAKNIIAWNIQNDVLNSQRNFYMKPRLLYQNRAYLKWLNSLVNEIKEIDSIRPVIVDLETNLNSIYTAKIYLSNIEGIDNIGLLVKNKKYLDTLISHLNNTKINYLFSEIDTDILTNTDIFENNKSFYITAWQDAREISKTTFDGVIDRKGRYKTAYYALQKGLQNSTNKISKTEFRILKPARLIYDGRNITYSAMYYHNVKGWRLGDELKNYEFEWSLVKCDQYGNYLAVKEIGNGPNLHLKIPSNHKFFKLLLTTINGDTISTTLTTLNTPIEQQIASFE